MQIQEVYYNESFGNQEDRRKGIYFKSIEKYIDRMKSAYETKRNQGYCVLRERWEYIGKQKKICGNGMGVPNGDCTTCNSSDSKLWRCKT